jgi:hypothetical protein
MAGQNQIFETTMQSAAASGSGTAVYCGSAEHIAIFIEWSAGGSGGVLSIEEARTSSYAGTWSVLATITQAGASQTDVVHMTGAFKAVRARLSTGVTGGTVTVVCQGSSGE